MCCCNLLYLKVEGAGTPPFEVGGEHAVHDGDDDASVYGCRQKAQRHLMEDERRVCRECSVVHAEVWQPEEQCRQCIRQHINK